MWDFLDVMDKNLLYAYAQMMAGERKQLSVSKTVKTDITIDEEREAKEYSKKRAYYLIWFVYRYILGCETVTEAMKYANAETLAKFRLTSYVVNSKIYLGVNGEIPFRQVEDIKIILEILYGRYNIMGQLECYIYYTSENNRVRAKRCRVLRAKYIKELRRAGRWE